jgi:hypothetical protein
MKKKKVKIKLFKFQKEIAKAIATLHRYRVECGVTIPTGYGRVYILEEAKRLICLQKKK